MSLRRFLVASPPERGVAVLDPEVSKHAAKVLRLREGDPVVLFDGQGTEWPGTVLVPDRRGFRVRVGEPRAGVRPPGPRVVLGTAIPKGKRMATLLAMATEAGVDLVVPVAFAWSAVREPGDSKVEHWERTMTEAARQSGRAFLPVLEEETPLRDFLARPRTEGERRILPTTSESPPPLPDLLSRGPMPSAVALLVGPEGGFAPGEEEAAAAAGFEACSLGPHVLRIETAGVVAVAMTRAVASPRESERAGG